MPRRTLLFAHIQVALWHTILAAGAPGMLRRYLRQAVTLLGAARTDLVVCPVVHPSECLRHTLLSRAHHFLLIGSFEYITFVFNYGFFS